MVSNQEYRGRALTAIQEAPTDGIVIRHTSHRLLHILICTSMLFLPLAATPFGPAAMLHMTSYPQPSVSSLTERWPFSHLHTLILIAMIHTRGRSSFKISIRSYECIPLLVGNRCGSIEATPEGSSDSNQAKATQF